MRSLWSTVLRGGIYRIRSGESEKLELVTEKV